MEAPAVLFPGQGAQYPGMGEKYAGRFAECREIYEKASEISSLDLLRLCLEGTQEELDRTSVSQPAIFVTSVASLRAYQLEHGSALEAAASAGLSLGEYTALYFAGSLSFEDAVHLVSLRGKLMEECAEATPGGMTSVLNLDPESIEEVVSEIGREECVCMANFNSPSQTVISGTLTALEKAEEALKKRGARTVRLKVAGAFHSSLMEPAKEKLAVELQKVNFSPPRIPVVSNVTARYHEPSSIKQLLLEQLTSPVRWHASMEFLIAKGFGRFVEPAPGSVLTRLLRRMPGELELVSLNSG